MGDVDEGDAKLIFQTDQLVLHVLAQLQIQSAQGLIQKKDLRFIDDGSRDGDPLLLSAGQQRGRAVFVAFQVDQLQRVFDLVINISFGLSLDLLAESNVFSDGHMGEKCVFLKNSVQLPLVRRKFGDVFAVKEYASLVRIFESAQDPEGRGLAAAAGTQQSQKFIFPDIEVQVVQNGDSIVDFGDIHQIDQFVAHGGTPFNVFYGNSFLF